MRRGGLDPDGLHGSRHACIHSRGLGETRGDHPAGWARGERRAGSNHEARATGAAILASLVQMTDLSEEAGEDGLVQTFVGSRAGRALESELGARILELRVQILPFAHAH